MKRLNFYPLFIFLFFTSQILEAQERRFGAGIALGANYSQLNETNQFGAYYGLNTGLIGTMTLSKRLQLGIEMLYSMNGDYVQPFSFPETEYRNVLLHHLEVPIHIDYLLKKPDKQWFYKFDASLGAAYATLLAFHAEDIAGTNLTERIAYQDRYSIMVQGGLTYYVSKHIGLNTRITVPVTEKGRLYTLSARLLFLI